jgi:hypothetical protein
LFYTDELDQIITKDMDFEELAMGNFEAIFRNFLGITMSKTWR